MILRDPILPRRIIRDMITLFSHSFPGTRNDGIWIKKRRSLIWHSIQLRVSVFLAKAWSLCKERSITPAQREALVRVRNYRASAKTCCSRWKDLMASARMAFSCCFFVDSTRFLWIILPWELQRSVEEIYL